MKALNMPRRNKEPSQGQTIGSKLVRPGTTNQWITITHHPQTNQGQLGSLIFWICEHVFESLQELRLRRG